MDPQCPFVLPLDSDRASRELLGGQGFALAKLVSARFPVPPGFVITTSAYERFAKEVGFHEHIQRIATVALAESIAGHDPSATDIQSLFDAKKMPRDVTEAIGQAYRSFESDSWAVAVRSSATAEDSSELSFAGQQESFLNVRGSEALLAAVCRCWASLWTTRAIAYRMRLHSDRQPLAMAVVVQRMIPSDVSGVLFTANPSSGDQSEMVINANYGLGESVVAGEVTPDTFIVDRASLTMKRCVVGSKESMVILSEKAGTTRIPVPNERRQKLVLSHRQLRELAELGLRAETRFDGKPQDMEWAISDDKVWVLQSRPITHLPPPPLVVSWDPPYQGSKLIRRQVVENMPDPLSPLFDELYLQVGLEKAIDRFLEHLGMKMDIGAMVDRPFFLTVNGYAYSRASYRMSWRLIRALPGIVYAYVIVVPRMLKNIEKDWREDWLPEYLKTVKDWARVDSHAASDQQLLDGIRALATADAVYWFSVSMVLASAKLTDALLNRFLRSRLVPGNLISGMFLVGFPSKTIEAQLELEEIARTLRHNDRLSKLVNMTPVSDLLGALSIEPTAVDVVKRLHAYFETYGHQVYNLDFAEPTQSENPRNVLLSLRALVEKEESDTRVRQTALRKRRDELIESTESSIGPVRRWLFRKILRWAQGYGPCREEALFYMGSAWPTLRRIAMELGGRLAASGTLNARDDVFFLTSGELASACNMRSEAVPRTEFADEAARRRSLRTARKRLNPPGMIPEGSRWKFGPFDMTPFETQKRNDEDSKSLSGFAVSPGKVTGIATVILSPQDVVDMRPDTILVCPTTTPAWTPLFSSAIGLVTDIGGILAHGSIVAREYGIPAVLGTGNATRRITSGQRITVDGNRGEVTIVDD